MRKLVLLSVALLVMTALGCSPEPEIVPATKHAPSDPAKVKFYAKEPAKYEVLETIKLPVAANASWDDRGNANAGFKQFQERPPPSAPPACF
jgi:hypothetical protein